MGDTRGADGGAKTGAALGASMGSAVPIVGTAIGAALGAIGGGIGGAIKSRRDTKKERDFVERQARAAGLNNELASIARQALFSKKAGDAKLDEAVMELIAADDSQTAATLFDFIDQYAGEDNLNFNESLMSQADLENVRATFVTQSSGTTLQAAGLLRQLSGSD